MVVATSYAIIVSTYIYPVTVYIITTMTSTYFEKDCIHTHKEHNHKCVLDNKYYVHE